MIANSRFLNKAVQFGFLPVAGTLYFTFIHMTIRFSKVTYTMNCLMKIIPRLNILFISVFYRFILYSPTNHSYVEVFFWVPTTST